MISGQLTAIVWAQWRSILNYQSGGRRRRFPFAAVFAVIWYAIWAFGAYALAVLAARPENLDLLAKALPGGLLVVFGYWQLVPIMMASTGLSLDLNRLLVYPIPHVQLFAVEVVLRISTCMEMIIITSGLAIGLVLNPRVPLWGVSGLLAFTLLNLFLSAGLRDLFTRLMSRKRFREVAVFLIVLLAAAPQVIMTTSGANTFRGIFDHGFGIWWPWSTTAAVALGLPGWYAIPVLLVWTAAAYVFSRRQFEKSIHTDKAEGTATPAGPRRVPALLDLIARIPRVLFRDPLAALIEKELRTLGRSPRFRLLFMMGFSFGLLIWLPMAMRSDPDSPLSQNYLTIVSAYALMLLGEVCLWNSFGIDRTAAQTYFVMPLDFRTVILAKNLASIVFIVIELALVIAFCAALRMPVTLEQTLEAFGVTAVLALFLMAAGNLLSTRYPRPVNPAHSWRTGSMSRVQAYLLLIYPIASIPILLAYGARYAFDTGLALYAVLAIDLVLGAILYSVAMDSAVASAREHQEYFVNTLSSGEGPVG